MPFATTRWTLILQAREEDSEVARAALETLCQTYWPPVYGYLRSQGYPEEDAKDLTQEFFTDFLATEGLSFADRERGRFRNFLLTCVNNFLVNVYRKKQAKKRNPGPPIVSLDAVDAERKYATGLREDLTPEKVFERQWALTVMREAAQQLEETERQNGRDPGEFELLRPYLAAGEKAVPYAELAQQLSVTESAAKVRVHRLRRRYGQQIRAAIAHTVRDPNDVDTEMRYFMQIFSGR